MAKWQPSKGDVSPRKDITPDISEFEYISSTKSGIRLPDAIDRDSLGPWIDNLIDFVMYGSAGETDDDAYSDEDFWDAIELYVHAYKVHQMVRNQTHTQGANE